MREFTVNGVRYREVQAIGYTNTHDEDYSIELDIIEIEDLFNEILWNSEKAEDFAEEAMSSFGLGRLEEAINYAEMAAKVEDLTRDKDPVVDKWVQALKHFYGD